MSAKLVVGVDVGLGGAFGVLNHDSTFCMLEDLPVVARGRGRVKRELDGNGLANLLRPIARDIRLCCVEAPTAMPRQGSASTFSLGHSLGVVCGVIEGLGIPLVTVSPSAWKRRMNLSADKELCRATASRLFPQAELHLKKHADRAEALLLARYALTNH